MRKVIVVVEILMIAILFLLYSVNPFEKIIGYSLYLKIGVVFVGSISVVILSLNKNEKNKVKIAISSIVILLLIFLINYFTLTSK